MTQIANIMLAIFIGVAFLLMIEFTMINMILGCETWNEQLWDENNSCISLSKMLGF
jgi:hypothetical protein